MTERERTQAGEVDVAPNWFREEAERARARLASLPKWARPVRILRPPEPELRGCRCGHPGAGCYCPTPPESTT